MRITVGYTEHALQRIDERGLSKPIVEAILRNPEDVELNSATRNPIHNTYSFAFDDYRIIATPDRISDDHLHLLVVTVMLHRNKRLGRRQRRKYRQFANAAQRKVMHRGAVHA